MRRSVASCGSSGATASLSANLVVVAAVFSARARRLATAITSRSRNGVRSSSPCAIAVRSALTRMSPGSQVLMSISCMVATSSSSLSAAWSKIGSVTSCTVAPPYLVSTSTSSAPKMLALPMYLLRSGVAIRPSRPLPFCPAGIRSAIACAEDLPQPGSLVAALTTPGW